MRIFFFTESGLGVARLLVTQAIFINRTNPDIICGISSMEQDAGLIQELKNNGIRLTEFKEMELHRNFYSHFRLLRKTVKKNHIDIVHCQTNWQLIMAYLVKLSLLNKQKLKLIYTIHGYRNNKSVIKKKIAKFLILLMLFLCADKVIATCESLKQEFKILGNKICIINLGVDDSFINNKETDGESIKGLQMIFPARFREGKRQEMIISSFYQYIKSTDDNISNLYLPGDGETMPMCIELVNKLKLYNRCFFPGLLNKSELIKLYNKCNILVCSSISETYCQTIVEAFCLGKCIISTPVGVAPELINKKNMSGFIFHSERELIDVFMQLNREPSKLIAICEHNKKNTKKFSWSNITNSYLSMIKNTI